MYPVLVRKIYPSRYYVTGPYSDTGDRYSVSLFCHDNVVARVNEQYPHNFDCL
jgi:hypothetical protein